MYADAVMSDCGRYRYRLTRSWDENRGRLTFVMLNPSTADASVDDPTIRRCMGFAHDLGLGRIDVVNLYPWRATDPRDLQRAAGRWDVVQREERDRWILSTLAGSNTAPIAAWGGHRMARAEVVSVVRLAPRWMALGSTMSGAPRHPLYLPRSARPSEWAPDGR